MSAQMLSVTVVFRCDGFHCEHAANVTSTDLPSARLKSAQMGWRVGRARGYERVTCPSCTREEDGLVAAGVVNKQGLVLDAARYDVWLDRRMVVEP